VLLKRSASATIREWLLAGEHLLVHGASEVIFCERGIRTFDPSTRYLLDLAAVVEVKAAFHQQVIVDPSHATGRRDLIIPLSRAAIAAGADGLLVECHPNAREALSDGPQALTPDELAQLAHDVGLLDAPVARARLEATHGHVRTSSTPAKSP